MDPSPVNMFNNSFLSDVKIRLIYGDSTKEYFGHKAVLCTESEWFMTAFCGRFKEATERIVNLHDDDPMAFEVMLKFIYIHAYDVPAIYGNNPHQKRILAINVFALAHKYGVNKLKKRAVEEFPACSTKTTGTQAEQIIEAHFSKCARMECPMAEKIVDTVRNYAKEMFKAKQYEALVKKYPDFAVNMLLLCIRSNGRCW